MQRWEDAAPQAVIPNLTPEEIAARQGTRANDLAPWETYDSELDTDSPEMLEAMAEYAQNVSDAKPSSQTQEELCRLQEASENAAKEYRWVTPEEYKYAGDRIGRIMHSVVFINKLREAGVKCWYRQHPQAGKITLVIQKHDNQTPEVGCWCMIGFAPELSVMRFDEHGVPTTEKYRGWRTCLLQLILKGVISEKKAEELFGKPATTPAFHRYNQTLQHFRNQGSMLDKS
jgi:hypothetical protein